MKSLVCVLVAFAVIGCDGKSIFSLGADPTPDPVTPAPTPKPTPVPGEWRLKDYRNPLEQKPRK